jgi:hypothetical protein
MNISDSGDKAKAEMYRDRMSVALSDVLAIMREAQMKDAMIIGFNINPGPDGNPEAKISVMKQITLL